MDTMNQVTDVVMTRSDWKSLYAVGGMAAVIMAVFIPVQVIVFVVWPPPSTVAGWFTLLQSSKLVGLFDLDLLLIIDQVLLSIILLGLTAALWRIHSSFMAIALMLGLIGVATYFASTSAFEMLSLSNRYAAAAGDAERSVVLTAGEVMIANWQGTAFDVGYILEGVALLIVGVVMLRSPLFGKVTAYVGIVLGIMSLLPPTAGTVGLFFALGSLVPLEIWDILIARRFFQLARR